MGGGNKMAAPSRASVRALGSELIEVLKSQGISVYKLTKGERDKFKAEINGLEEKIVTQLGGQSKMVYDLVNKGKESFRKR